MRIFLDWNGNVARFDYETESATDLISDVSSFITDNRVIYFNKYDMLQGVFRYDIKSKLITKVSNQIVSSLESCWNNKYLYYYLYDGNNPNMEFATYCLDLDSDISFLFLDNGTKNLQVFGDKVYYAPFSGDNTSTDLYVREIDGTNKQVLIPSIVDFKIINGKIYYAKCQKDYGSSRADFNIHICEIDGTNSICISDDFVHQCLHRIDADGVYIDTGSLIEHYEYSSHQDKVISVTINGIKIAFDQTPIIKENRTLVPLRAIFEAMNATVDWNDATKTVTSTKGNTSVSMTIGQDIFYKNGEVIQLDVPAQIVGGRTLIPVRAIAESFDCEVKWDSETQTVIINK